MPGLNLGLLVGPGATPARSAHEADG